MEHISNLDAHSGDQGLLKLEDNLNKMEPEDNHSESPSNVETDVVEKKDSVVQRVADVSSAALLDANVTFPAANVMVDTPANGADKSADRNIQQDVQDAVEKLQNNVVVIEGLRGFKVRVRDNDHPLIVWNNRKIDQSLCNFVEEINQKFSLIFLHLSKLKLKDDKFHDRSLYSMIYRALLYMGCRIWNYDFVSFTTGAEELKRRDKNAFETILSEQGNEEWMEAFNGVMLLQCYSLIDMVNVGAMSEATCNAWRLNEMLLPHVHWKNFSQGQETQETQETYVMSLHDLMKQADEIMLRLMRVMGGCFFPPDSLLFSKRIAVINLLEKHRDYTLKMCEYLQCVHEFLQGGASVDESALSQKYKALQDISKFKIEHYSQELDAEYQYRLFAVALKKYAKGLPGFQEDFFNSLSVPTAVEAATTTSATTTAATTSVVDSTATLATTTAAPTSVDSPAHTVVEPVGAPFSATTEAGTSATTETTVTTGTTATAPVGAPSNAKKITLSVIVILCTITIITASAVLVVMAVIHFVAFIVIGIVAVVMCIMLLAKIVSYKSSGAAMQTESGYETESGAAMQTKTSDE